MAKNDPFLHAKADEVMVAAQYLVYEAECKLYSKVSLTNIAKSTGKTKEEGREAFEKVMHEEGYRLHVENDTVQLCGVAMDSKGKIMAATADLVRRARDLNNNYKTMEEFIGKKGPEV
jgi:hypothetical protein